MIAPWLRKRKYETTLCYPPPVPVDITKFTDWLIKKGIISVSELAGMPYDQLYELFNKYAEQYWSEIAPQYQGVFLIFPRMRNLVDIYRFTIGYNSSYNFLIDFHFALNLHLEIPELKDIIDNNFTKLFPSYTKVQKGRYGETYYDLSYYDPPEITPLTLRHFAWDTRYKYTKKIVPIFDQGLISLQKYVDAFREIWSDKDIADFIIPMILEQMTIVEGKILNSMYVGLWIVGVSRIPPKSEVNEFAAKVKIRNPYSSFEETHVESVSTWDNQVGFMRVGFFRVAPKKDYVKDKSKPLFPKEVAEYLANLLEYLVTANGYKGDIFIPTVRYLNAGEKKKWNGGKHQVIMQRIIEQVKPILDRFGVMNWHRTNYYNFAMEMIYRNHESNRKRKNWKSILTVDDLIEKYKSLGCDENVLNEIARLVR